MTLLDILFPAKPMVETVASLAKGDIFGASTNYVKSIPGVTVYGALAKPVASLVGMISTGFSGKAAVTGAAATAAKVAAGVKAAVTVWKTPAALGGALVKYGGIKGAVGFAIKSGLVKMAKGAAAKALGMAGFKAILTKGALALGALGPYGWAILGTVAVVGVGIAIARAAAANKPKDEPMTTSLTALGQGVYSNPTTTKVRMGNA